MDYLPGGSNFRMALELWCTRKSLCKKLNQSYTSLFFEGYISIMTLHFINCEFGVSSFFIDWINHIFSIFANRLAKDDSLSYQVKNYYIHSQTFLCIQIGILLIGSYREASNYTLQWTSYFIQSFNSSTCHSARRACLELQNPRPHE